MSSISACLVVYHEEARIRGCLESFSDVVDEIVVVHDGPCADGTLSIAREYTDKVCATETRSGSAEFNRPFALEQCTMDWVLVIDADERLSEPLRRSLRSLAASSEFDAWGFAWPYVDASGTRVSSHSMSGKKFLFRRKQMYTIGLPHMTPESFGRTGKSHLEVHHVLEHGSSGVTFRTMLLKNRRRGRAAAAKLAGGLEQIATYNASVFDDRSKNTRKIQLIARHPLLALCVIPTWGFVYWYFVHGYVKAGRIGVHDALNLPLFYASFAWNLFRLRSSRKAG